MTPAFDAAIACAQAHETPWPRRPADPAPPGAAPWGVHHDDPPPFNRLRGPVHERGPQSGVLWQRGEPLVRWGEPGRADLTFNVAKTYFALLAGIAQRDGLLLWLNRNGRAFAGASTHSLFMLGAGGQLVWVEPDHDMVLVLRWLDPAHLAEAVSRFAAALA